MRTWTLRTKGTDWTGKPLLPIHTGVYEDPLTPPIALVHIGTEQGEARANLIAAAPELLEQLRLARRQLSANGMTDDELAPIDSAISKAEGR